MIINKNNIREMLLETFLNIPGNSEDYLQALRRSLYLVDTLHSIGFNHIIKSNRTIKKPRFILYNSHVNMLLALEFNGTMRFISPSLPKKENINDKFANPKMYNDGDTSKLYQTTNIEDISGLVEKMYQSYSKEFYQEEIKVEDLPLLSPEEENRIKESTYINFIQNPCNDKIIENWNNHCQDLKKYATDERVLYELTTPIELTIEQAAAIKARKCSEFNKLPQTMKKIINTPSKILIK